MRLESVRQGYERALEWVVIALMAALAVEVTAGIVFRTVGYSLVWYDEVASILLAWLTFYGSALAAVKRAHIGCPEVVEPGVTGFVANPFDTQGFPECIARLLREPELAARMGAAGRQRLEQLSTIERLADEFLEEYELALAQRRTG